MELFPFSSTQTTAMPVDTPSTVLIARVSTLACCRFRTSSPPRGSSPTALRNAVSPPRRPQAYAWLAPFPPQVFRKERHRMVSPNSGACRTPITKSTFALPTTKIFFNENTPTSS
ncbi:Uncharacterised protein [Flavonifractor plautii]|uniref:Uncharacterized protein n=1 Tax=Flavonifractor plautii TaxID=292800 RepID=A0A174FDJ5_FLAPL|nr:Uncharacterised protein [Flavonifractor plautii]